MRRMSYIPNLIKQAGLRLLLGIGWISRRHRTSYFDKNRVAKILVIALGGIGDVIRLFPAMEALRLNFPTAALTLLTSTPPDVFNLLPAVNEFPEVICTETAGGFTRLPEKLALIYSLRQRNFDLIFDPS